MGDNQKKYEEAARRHSKHFSSEHKSFAIEDFLAGASFAEKEAWNAAIDKALKCFTADAYASHNDVWKEIEKLKL